ncbi:RagB/SusD family nutrient uptake outer membrane protein [Pedobacter sp. PLR]|uniref:RagB/SusD family nutrient uptake outer membrane protein n=1 Tax=Pedobacter sp. PLR TaxID=2994465 RepID=UPI002245944B|nr:RagB/SusD family nutrient uptake outer membrane protein [Pedobacter sp. PLR]MCX2449750.1 RagB/SusD family nutrient uptake outer membrane protein [Pedobacter sp. PLR]
MKHLKYSFFVIIFFTISCKKIIAIDPISNIGVENFYKNYEETKVGLTGSYNGLQLPLETEWMLTELRSDNTKQGVPNSSASINVEFNELDMFTLNSSHDKVYRYWLHTYKNIRSVNYVLKSLGLIYENGSLKFTEGSAKMTEAQSNQLAGEALFLRAYHYFNLVRLYGGVFLITTPVDPKQSKQLNRSSIQDCYQLIVADLSKAKDLMSPASYGAIPDADRGRATSWAAKALLAKVYLTLNQKNLALPLLDDVLLNSGYGLLNSYSDVFSINNELNKEILFSVRFKAGGFGLGNKMANSFAPTSSGNAVINGDGLGYNFPTAELDGNYKILAGAPVDQRRDIAIGKYGSKLYVKKFISPVLLKDDAENDFPVIRFSDVMLMKAEALGFDGPSGVAMGLINQVRERSGAANFVAGDFKTGFYKYPSDASQTNAVTDDGKFIAALFNERRLEFSFENQRFFDLLRSGQAIEVLKAHFSTEFPTHYKSIVPAITVVQLQSNVVDNRMLLPIPQKEIDSNDQLKITQNNGY